MGEFQLLPAQKKFLEIPHQHCLDVALYQGGYGSGKTFSGALLGLMLAIQVSGIRGLVGAQTLPLVRDTTLVTYFEHMSKLGLIDGKHYRYYKAEQKIVFSNGSEILFRHLEESDKIKSLNLGFVEVEEMSDIPESTFLMLLGRLRQAGITRYRFFGHTNPEGNKGWIYKHFVENPKPYYRLIIAPTTQNTYLPESYVQSLKDAYDPSYYRINVLGEFGDYARGLVVKGFSDDNIKEISYCPDLPLHICCDFNVDPMCWVLAHKTENKIFYFDEIAIENTHTSEAIQEFLRRYGHHEAEIIINGDASGDNRSVNSEYTNYVQIVNALKKVYPSVSSASVKIKPFNTSVRSRIAAWNAKICNASRERQLFIDPKCKWLLYNVHNLKYKEGTGLIDVPSLHQIKASRDVKFLGHPFDAASYLVDYYYPIKFERTHIAQEKEQRRQQDNYGFELSRRSIA